MTSNDDTTNPIEAVRAVLDGGRHWIKGALQNDRGGYCMVGAAVATGDCWALHGNGVREVICEQFPERVIVGRGAVISRFNNHPDTTWADVDLVLDKAARAYDEQVRP